MRIVSMAVAALIAMTAGVLADQKTTTKDSVPKFPSKDYEIIVPNGWSVVAYDEVDSTCIGDMSDPKCALETQIACGVYKTVPCGGSRPVEPRGFFRLYRILKTEPVLKIRSYRVDDARDIYRWKPKLGDMHFVVEQTSCDGKFQRDVGYICDMRKKQHYFLRKQADGNWDQANVFRF